MHVWSDYNFFVEEESRTGLLYNSRTGNLIRLDKERCEQLKSGELLDNTLFDFLYRLDFIIPEDLDEIKQIENKNEDARNDRSFLSITVELTEACNLRCSYCYQSHKKEHLVGNAEDGIINLISNRCDDLKVVQLNWFGGEPLLRLKEIRRISKRVREFLKVKDIEYKQHMTTNGYLLTKKVAQELMDGGVDNIQITLDGAKFSHDKTRKLASGKGTYDRVVNACQNAVSVGMELMVRVNLTKENYTYVDELLSTLRLKNINPTDTIIHIVRTIDHGNLEDQTSDICFTNEEFGNLWPKILKKVAKYGFSVPSISPVSYNCPFDLDHAVMIGRDGSVRQCSSTDNVIGFLDRNTGHVKKQTNYKKFKHRIPTSDPHCRECKCLPLCMGGCAYLEGKRQEKCNPEKYAIEEIVKLYAKQHLSI